MGIFTNSLINCTFVTNHLFKIGVPFKGLIFFTLIVISGFYTTTSFSFLDYPLFCSEDLGFVPVSANAELGTPDFCVEAEARTALNACNEDDPFFNNPEGFLSALPPEQNHPFTLEEATQKCRHLNKVFTYLIANSEIRRGRK